jgi:hypothetical protein
METIQYSLNNISIDIRLALQNSKAGTHQGTFQIQTPITPPLDKTNDKNNNKDIIKEKTDIFDKYCLDTYGNRTCILFETDTNKFEVRFLNKQSKNTIYRNSFYKEIPNLVEDRYTVVVVENIQKINKKEIVAIHSPSNGTF